MVRHAADALPRRFGAALLVGASIGASCLLLGHALRPGVAFDMDRALPKSAAGFHPIEIVGEEAYVWTSARAVLRLPGLNRRTPWSCVIRFRGVRPPALPQPRFAVAVDGVQLASALATNEYRDLAVTLQRRSSGPGAILILSSDPVFVPGNGDPRELGVQIDHLACEPRRAWLVAPTRVVLSAAASAALLAGAVALAGASLPASAAAAVAVALGQTVLLTSQAALYGPYAGVLLWLALWLAGVLVLVVRIPEWIHGIPLQPTALTAVAISALAFFLKTLGLLHPAKPAVDAVFQAHRLEWVLDGRYLFTQPMPDGVEFPYAIGLYVFAAPWTLLTQDFVSLLRIIVVAVEALAGGLLYLTVVRTWRDGQAAAWAVALFHLAPLPYAVVGNANLTNAFGQSAALTALALAIAVPLGWRRFGVLAGLTGLVSLAFLSHVSTLALLGAILGALVCCLWVIGGGPRRPAAVALTIATIAAAVLSTGVYYRHFGDVYARAMTRVSDSGGPDAEPLAESREPASDDASSLGERPVASRVALALREANRAVGWPLLLLAAAGACTLRRGDFGTPLAFGLYAWLGVWVLFTGLTVTARVGAEFERYAVEFLGRVNLATYPAVVLLAARGVSKTLTRGSGQMTPWNLAGRMAVGSLVVCALATGIGAWFNWFG